MEIVKLEFQGIGPFTDRHVIDFRDIGHSGLFLLEGPTGSGKTTILDAIVFALYGGVAGGADSSKGRIVSTMLTPGREPYVDAVIDSGQGLLRVRRTPDYERPRLRGQGTTTSRATIKLWKLSSPDDQEGAPVSTSIAEADEELRRAIGLTREQFTQTVMLPQGNFATFLRAKPDDRRNVLQDIFGTQLYETFTKRLAQLAQVHRASTERARDGLLDVAANFCQVAWDDDAPAAVEPIPERVAFDEAAGAEILDTDALRDGASRRCTALDAQLAAAQEAAEAASARHANATDVLSQLKARNALINELTTLIGRRATLREVEAGVERDDALLAAAERAEHVRRPLANQRQAIDALDESRRTCDVEVQRISAGRDADLVREELSADGLRTHEDTARTGANLLQRIVDLEEGVPSRRAAADVKGRAQDDERARIEEEHMRAEQCLADALALGEQLTAREEVAATLASAVESQAAAEQRLTSACELERLTRRLAKARVAELSAKKDQETARIAHDEARNVWLDSIAGELALELVEGEPCSVCGSRMHPAPAARSVEAIGRDEVERLAEASDGASRKAAAVATTCTEIAEQIAEKAPLSDGLDMSQAKALVTAATTASDEAQQATSDVRALRQRIDSLNQAARTTERLLQSDRESLAAGSASLEVTLQEIERDQAEVIAEAAGFSSVRDRQRALTARANTANHLADLLRAVSLAEESLDRCMSELSLVLAERGFPTIGEAQAALLADSERARLCSAISAHRDDVAGVESQLQSDRFTGLAGTVPEDPSSAQDAEQQADAAQREAHRLRGAIESTVRSTDLASKDLNARIADYENLRDEAGPLLRMANLANAGEGNLQHVTLPTYVLLRRFEEVVDLANLRLDAMTGGRYELRRTDEREGRSMRQGLGLEVVDHQARDTKRDPKTLSGGETFMASLSLALGLADAVTAEAGGIQIHTMFVDEGFGSLDPETLDAVMQQLSALRDAGRSVGVVSHVAEMKQRIAERVTVVPRGDGTSTLTCSTSG